MTYNDIRNPVRSDWSDFDSSTPEGMRGVLGAELKFMGHDRKLSLLPHPPPPGAPQARERACTQATFFGSAVIPTSFPESLFFPPLEEEISWERGCRDIIQIVRIYTYCGA